MNTKILNKKTYLLLAAIVSIIAVGLAYQFIYAPNQSEKAIVAAQKEIKALADAKINRNLEDEFAIEIFVGGEEADHKDLGITINSWPEVKKVDYIPREQAWAEFRELFKSSTETMQLIEGNPVPAAYQISTKDPKGTRLVYKRIKTLPGIKQRTNEIRYADSIRTWMKLYNTVFFLPEDGLKGLEYNEEASAIFNEHSGQKQILGMRLDDQWPTWWKAGLGKTDFAVFMIRKGRGWKVVNWPIDFGPIK